MTLRETELDDRQTLALAKLPRDLAIVKIENDTMMSIAASQPRDHALMLEDLKQQLSTYKAFCEQAMYAKPVGKDKNGKMKFARGLSIRSAEALAEIYGSNKVRCDPIVVDNDTVRLEASFTDYQKGKVWQCSGLVCKTYTTRHGRTERWSDDRFNDVVVPAKASKLIRECILRSVPPGLRIEMENTINEQLDSFLDESTTQKIIAQFSTKAIDQSQLEQHIGKRVENFNKENRATLLGLWNAIEQDDMTVAEIFGEQAKPEEPKGSRTDAVARKVTPPPRPDPATQAKANEQVQKLRAAEAETNSKTETLTEAQVDAEAHAEHLLPDDMPPPEAGLLPPRSPPAESTPPEATGRPEGFCPIAILGELSQGDVIATAGKIDGTGARILKSGPVSEVGLSDGTHTYRFIWKGTLPKWAELGVSVDIQRAEVARFHYGKPELHIRDWRPSENLAEEVSNGG